MPLSLLLSSRRIAPVAELARLRVAFFGAISAGYATMSSLPLGGGGICDRTIFSPLGLEGALLDAEAAVPFACVACFSSFSVVSAQLSFGAELAKNLWEPTSSLGFKR